MKQRGCEGTERFNGTSFLSLRLLLDFVIWKKEGVLIDIFKEHFEIPNIKTGFVRFGGVRVVLTADPENVKSILAYQFGDFALGTRHTHIKPLLGDGIFTLDGEGWKHFKALLRPQFARDQVANVKSLEPHIKAFAKHIKKNEGTTFDIQPLFYKLTVDISTKTLFGESVHSLLDQSIGSDIQDFDGKLGVPHALNTAQAYLTTRAYTQVFYFLVNNS